MRPQMTVSSKCSFTLPVEAVTLASNEQQPENSPDRSRRRDVERARSNDRGRPITGHRGTAQTAILGRAGIDRAARDSSGMDLLLHRPKPREAWRLQFYRCSPRRV